MASLQGLVCVEPLLLLLVVVVVQPPSGGWTRPQGQQGSCVASGIKVAATSEACPHRGLLMVELLSEIDSGGVWSLLEMKGGGETCVTGGQRRRCGGLCWSFDPANG